MLLNPIRWSFRSLLVAGSLSCFALIAYAYYLQVVEGLEPCPLCIFQRIGFMAVGAILLLGALHNPARVGRRIYGILGGLAAIAGGSIAARHIWLRHLPEDQVPACGPGLDFMLEAFPLSKTLKTVFTGSGECAKSDGWFLLGLDMPSWALIAFAGFLLLCLFAGFKAKGKEAKT